MDEFIDWYCSGPRLALNRGVVLRYRMQLESKQLAPATIDVRLAAVRRLADEAAGTGLLPGTGCRHPPGLEESLVAAASVYEPVFAIGAPGRQLRAVGAAREYAPVDGWQEAVRQKMQESAAIVAVLVTTGGLSWELCLTGDLGLNGKLPEHPS